MSVVVLALGGMAVIAAVMLLIMRGVDKRVKRQDDNNPLLDRTSGDITDRWYK